MFAHAQICRWRTYLLVFFSLYIILCLFLAKYFVFDGQITPPQRYKWDKSLPSFVRNPSVPKLNASNSTLTKNSKLLHGIISKIGKSRHKSEQTAFSYRIKVNNEDIFAEEVLPNPGVLSLQERLSLSTPVQKKSLLLMWDTVFTQENLRGCPDWNCEISTDRSLIEKADAVFFDRTSFKLKHRPDQYFVHYSQESPVNSMPLRDAPKGFFNLSFGFRQDTHGASPYGYTIKLAPNSRRDPSHMEKIEMQIRTKTKPIAWFVSHCQTSSGREKIVKALENFIPVDAYGLCGPLNCPKGSDCQDLINTDYYFYFSAENSICKDYITEKLWNQGYNYYVVPIVLKRAVVEPYVPPHSFIAVDDFTTIQGLAHYLKFLMNNTEEYLKYFQWRTDYMTLTLDNRIDPSGERIWGFCQICRVTQLNPRPQLIINDMGEFWDKSCEEPFELAHRILNKSGFNETIPEDVDLLPALDNNVDYILEYGNNYTGSIQSLWQNTHNAVIV
ncbi:glycosyltransferase family 10 (fucosyltransferase) c-term domain-containing protein [Ditylenchus destructor]|nr:glycosyltransferase family 10 (fucosyltransferase) c-term domain-containing protein [Ditylenchus destructor]